MGVTSTDPSTSPLMPHSPLGMKNAWLVYGCVQYQNGEEVGDWGSQLCVAPGYTVGVLWEDSHLHLVVNGEVIPAFPRINGPVWAVIGLGQVTKITASRAPMALGLSVPRSPPQDPGYRRTPVYHRSIQGDTTGQKMEECRNAWGDTSSSANTGSSTTFSQKRKRRADSTQCPNWTLCDRFLDTLELTEAYFDSRHDRCFCTTCIMARGDDLYYSRGEPPVMYGLPMGWARFGLRTPPPAEDFDIFRKWHVAFHGTRVEKLRPILQSQTLLMPGDINVHGEKLRPPAGHFTETRKPAGFDINKVFVSPTIAYAGHPAYAVSQQWVDPEQGARHNMKVAFQVRIKPGSYDVGPETVGLGLRGVDAKFDNTELEWATNNRGAAILVGLLVKSG